MTDLKKVSKFNQKKTRSVSSATLVGGSSAALDGGAYVADTATQELFTIPANSLITDCYIVVEEAGQGSLTADIGYAGSNELFNDADIDAVSVVKDAGIKLATGTGKTVTAKFSAAPTQGRFHVIVEYIEYTLSNGDFTA
jgi:hypothetical protein